MSDTKRQPGDRSAGDVFVFIEEGGNVDGW